MRVLATEGRSRSVWSVSGNTRVFVFVLTLLVFTFVWHNTARASSALSEQVAGTVVDQTGAMVGGASVVLFNAAGLETQRVLTDQRGRFTLKKVLAADYVSGLGFEVSPDEGVRLNGSTGRLDSSRRLIDIRPLEPIRAEQLYSYELALRFLGSRFSAGVAAFDSEISNLIERRTLLLPPGSVGQLVGGQPIIRQDATGAVFTSLSSSAVFVRTNALKVRLRGVEGSIDSPGINAAVRYSFRF